MTNTPEALDPCPFCGSVVVSREGFHMSCLRCGADGPDADYDSDEAATAAWNRRSQPQDADTAGFVLVPVEPTREMIEAFHAVSDKDEFAFGNAGSHWRAMIAAAPKP